MFYFIEYIYIWDNPSHWLSYFQDGCSTINQNSYAGSNMILAGLAYPPATSQKPWDALGGSPLTGWIPFWISELRVDFPVNMIFLSPKHSKTQKSRLNFSDDWWTRPQVCSVSRMCEPVACWMTPAFRVYPHVWLLSYPPKIYISYWSPNRSDPITRRSSGAYRIWDIMGSMEQKWASGRPLRIWWLADMSVCIYK